jgi:hypothetical protein
MKNILKQLKLYGKATLIVAAILGLLIGIPAGIIYMDKTIGTVTTVKILIGIFAIALIIAVKREIEN